MTVPLSQPPPFLLSHTATDAATKHAAFQAYIAYEQLHGDPSRVQLIFERALAESPLNPDLWLAYVTHLVGPFLCRACITMQDGLRARLAALVDSTFSRALRNCPWSGALWRARLVSRERHAAAAAEACD